MSSIHNGDDADVFERWSAVLADVYIAWRTTNVQFAAGPAEGSPASRDDVVLAGLCRECDKPEGTGAGLDAVQMIDAAAQHVLGLRVLVDSRTVALTVWPVARAIAEHVAHAAWLLEPGIAPEARMARRWMARLAGAHRYRWMMAARKATRAQQRGAKETREAIRQQLLLRFPGADTEWDDPAENPGWTIAGETYPTLGKQSRLIENLGVESLAGVYDVLSLFAHPNPITLAMLVERNSVGDHVEFTYRVDTDQWVSVVRGASRLLYAAAHAACGYFALDAGHLEAWYDRCESGEQ
ncbi:hypothetical protein [Kribbella sp. VKM Ac-2568]|uniref:hypothetical protein n=1 Tax=Kribbella sp. VKM Ac-2568 TaxID=2512219 RepID=UPI0010461F66|nr:hypothetical protein [Kribbella sp. VKM Ac-2568]